MMTHIFLFVMNKNKILSIFSVFFLLGFFAFVNDATAKMCGSDNTGSCQVACSGSQRSINDSTNACSGALSGAGGTVCCSPAQVSEWPSAQCYALGGAAATDCADQSNTFDAGILLTSDCKPSVRCCLPSGKFNASNPLPNPQACTTKSCTDTSGQRCTSGPLTTCNAGERNVTDVCPSNGICCQTVPPNNNTGNGNGSGSTGTGLTGQLNYTLLEKIPGAEEAGSDLKSYLEALYKIALVLVTLSAVLMLSIGGFMYLTSAGNTAQMGNAKGVITDALIGLVIALFAWLLLYVINPDFVGGSINGLSPVSVAPGYSPAVPVSVEGQYTHAEAVAALQAQGISVTSSGNCSDQSNKTCTSLQGIPKSTVDNLIKLKQGCGCSFSVTGGTEVGHASHGTGRAVVDVSLSLRSFLLNNKGSLTSQYNVIKICATKDNQDVAMGCSYIEPQPHFHLVFKS